MFYHLQMPAEVELHPRHFGPTMRATLEDKLTKEVSLIDRCRQSNGSECTSRCTRAGAVARQPAAKHGAAAAAQNTAWTCLRRAWTLTTRSTNAACLTFTQPPRRSRGRAAGSMAL